MSDDSLGLNGSLLLISLDYQRVICLRYSSTSLVKNEVIFKVNFALRPTLTLNTTDFRLVLNRTDQDDIKHCCVFRFVHG